MKLSISSPSSKCLMELYFQQEMKKPEHLRKNYVMISCPCEKCKPGRL